MYKKTETTDVIKKTKYQIKKDISYIITEVNGVEKSRVMETSRKTKGGYSMSICYGVDIEAVQKQNPFTSNERGYMEKVLNYKESLPKIEDIDESKIYYVSVATYEIFDIKMNRIYLPITLDYIGSGLTNERYDLEKVLKSLKQNKYIIEVSEILDIPYYNANETSNKYLQITVLPDASWYDISKGYKDNMSIYMNIQNSVWTNYDPLNIKQYLKKDE